MMVYFVCSRGGLNGMNEKKDGMRCNRDENIGLGKGKG
jgi:hypothetical protein